MWEKGISAYIGLGDSLASVDNYLESARSYGYTRLFTSLHIPESQESLSLTDFRQFTRRATSLGYQVTADISAETLSAVGASLTNLEPLKQLGLATLRLDYGFSPQQMAELTHADGLDIELNASTAPPSLLDKLAQAGADFTKIRACHNYYPRPETGLSWTLFAERSQLFRDAKIKVLAFIPSLSTPRGPIFAGLPTLEKHRLLKPYLAAKELLASRLVDGLLFGDPLASAEELAAVAELSPNCIELTVTAEPSITKAERAILFAGHTNRLDPGESVIRSQQSRGLCHETIKVRKTQPRQAGSITIDNEQYLRYMGELQLVASPLPEDERVNTVAQVIGEELFLLPYIKPGDSFRFKEVKPIES